MTQKLRDYGEVNELRNNRTFKALMEQAIELSGDVKVLDNQYREVRSQIDDVFKEANVAGGVMYNGWRVNVIETEGRPKLNMKKLLRLLGPNGPTLIKQAMEPGVPTRYVQITPPSRTTEEDDE